MECSERKPRHTVANSDTKKLKFWEKHLLKYYSYISPTEINYKN